jgi:hypothetical protein
VKSHMFGGAFSVIAQLERVSSHALCPAVFLSNFLPTA